MFQVWYFVPNIRFNIVSDEDIINLNLPTGIPFIYEFDEDMKPTKSLEFICDEGTVKTGLEKIKYQTTKTYVRWKISFQQVIQIQIKYNASKMSLWVYEKMSVFS